MRLDGTVVSLAAFIQAVETPEQIDITGEIRARLIADEAAVRDHASRDAPVYGLTTGLGANLGHRLTADEAAAFQAQIIAGRNAAAGPVLPPRTGRATLLARIISARNGGSGLSVAMFDHLCRLFAAGFAPAIPQWGSIGASDLTQTAAFAAAVTAKNAPPLGPKDGMALISHSALTTALTAEALHGGFQMLNVAKQVIVLTFEGYGGNRAIFAPEINNLRDDLGQWLAAQWFHNALRDAAPASDRIQDPLSLRTVAPVTGATEDTLRLAQSYLESEMNGLSDSPAVLPDGSMHSTPNFANPALALMLGSTAQALAMFAASTTQRIQRLMNPDLTGLPRYLSPVGGASAGMVPIQKTAAALFAEIQMLAHAPIVAPAPVSDSVEDVAPMTQHQAQRLVRILHPLRLLTAIEAICAAQAVDLRAPPRLSPGSHQLHDRIRAVSARLDHDRALAPDIAAVAGLLGGGAEI